MRTKKQVIRQYLGFLNDEQGLGYSAVEMDNKIENSTEFAQLHELLLKELYSTREYKGQVVSTVRAFEIFCKIIIYQDLKTGRYVWNSFVKKQFLLWELNKQVCYMAHRGGGKTFFLRLYTIFKMFLLPYFDCCYATNTPRQKRRFMKDTEAMIDNNEFLLDKKDRRRAANREIPWGQDEMEYNQGSLESTTIGTTPRGGHYNLVMVDDILREDKKYTYEYTVNYLEGVLKPTTYTKKARYGVVGTPDGDSDPLHTLMNEKRDKYGHPTGKIIIGGLSQAGYFCQIYPAYNEKTKKVLIPEIWTYEELMEEKKRIGEIRFNREMMCSCTSYKNSLIGSALFRTCCDQELRILQKGEEGKKYIIFVDSATSDSPTADFCSMAVFEDDADNEKFILRHLKHYKGQPVTDPTGGTDDQTYDLYRLYKDFNKATIVVEKNNAGVALIQSIQALTSKLEGMAVDVVEHYTHVVSRTNLGKANDVIDYIEYGLKAGVIVFPADPEDIYTLDVLQKVKDEHLNFGVKKGKSGEKYEALSGHDDIFDSCFGAFKYRGDNIDTLPYAITMPGM